jgi:hypothetical protein
MDSLVPAQPVHDEEVLEVFEITAPQAVGFLVLSSVGNTYSLISFLFV